MKKLSFLGMALAASVGASAQNASIATELPMVPTKANEIEESIRVAKPVDRSAEVFYEDFANGLAGNNGVGAWTADGINADLWLQDFDGPNGFYTGGTTPVTSESVANGFMIFDTDYDATVANDPPDFSNRSGSLVSPTLDLSAHSELMLSFAHKFRFCCQNSHTLVLEVSENGGTSYDHVYPLNVGITANIQVDEVFKVNLSELADKSQLKFKFTWSAGGASVYYWMIDDVRFENVSPNDLAIVNAHHDDYIRSNDIKKGQTPVHSANNHDVGSGLGVRSFAAIFKNIGVTRDVYMTAKITFTGLDGSSSVVEIDNQNSPKSVGPNDVDTLFIDYAPAEWEVGNYEVEIGVETVGMDDDTPEDNSLVSEFDITNNTLGANVKDYTPQRANDNQDQDENIIPVHFFNQYVIFEDVELHAMKAAFPDPANGTPTDVGAQVAWGIFISDGNGGVDMAQPEILGTNTVIVEGAPVDSGLTADMIGTHINTLPFNAIDVDPNTGEFTSNPTSYTMTGSPEGNLYYAGVRLPSDAIAYLLDDGKSRNVDGASLIYGNLAGTGESFYGTSYHFVMELVFSELFEGVDEANNSRPAFYLAQNRPNPFNNGTTITYQLNKNANDVTFEVYDVTGKQVMLMNEGTKSAGQYNIMLDGSEFTTGLYYYSLTVNGQKLTRKMVITE